MEIDPFRNKILHGHVLTQLKRLPAKSVNMIATSTPYFHARGYGMFEKFETEIEANRWSCNTAQEWNLKNNDPLVEYIPLESLSNEDKTEWKGRIQINTIWGEDPVCKHIWDIHQDKGVSGGKKSEKVHVKEEENFQIIPPSEYAFCNICGCFKGELGHEPDPDLFVEHLCQVMDECWRVLRDDGTLWVNLGDSMNGAGGAGGQSSNYRKNHPHKVFGVESMDKDGFSLPTNIPTIPKKSLILIPQRFVLAMLKRGWTVRNEIHWTKLNTMPSSATDRFTLDYEYIYLFTKRDQYYFNQQLEPLRTTTIQRTKYNWSKGSTKSHQYQNVNGLCRSGSFKQAINFAGRNMRTTWEIPHEGTSELHFAVFPEALIKIPIDAGCPRQVCQACGEPRERIIERLTKVQVPPMGGLKNRENPTYSGKTEIALPSGTSWTVCACPDPVYRPGVVMDIFLGSGTTGLVAMKQGKDYLGIEINPQYITIAEKRLKAYQLNTRMDVFLTPKMEVKE